MISNNPPCPSTLKFKLCLTCFFEPLLILTNKISPSLSLTNTSSLLINVKPQGLLRSVIFFNLKSSLAKVANEKVKR